MANFLTNLRYVAWTPTPLEQIEEWIAGQSSTRLFHPDGCLYLAIETIRDPKLIGLVSLWFPEREFDPAQFEIMIRQDLQRHGYGTEAFRGLLSFAFTGLCVRRIVADCDARNIAARRLLVKVGMRQESECIKDRLIKGEWVNTVSFALLREEYKAAACLPAVRTR